MSNNSYIHKYASQADLMVEDMLNEEVKTLLESKTQEYERDMMDYGRVFQMVKSKLVRERGLIL